MKAILAFLLLPLALAAVEVRFQWRANTEPDLAGYRLYQGPKAGMWTNSFVISPMTTNYTLAISGTNYFALSAFNLAGDESGLTAPLGYRPPSPPSKPAGFTGTTLWLITEQSCDWVFYEPTITNEVASYWPAEVFRQKMIRKPLLP